MSTDTYTQSNALAGDLGNATGLVSAQICKVVNVLLAEAKKEHPDNVALAALEPFKPNMRSGADNVRAVVGQIVAATTPPAAAPVAVRSGPSSRREQF